MTSLAAVYDAALLDLDGVVYRGTDPVRHAAAAVAEARTAGMRVAFVTNNAARTPQVVAEQLTGLGVPASAAEVVTSAQAAAHLLADQLPAGARVLVVGGDGLVTALAERALTPVFTADDAPAAVVSGLHPDVGWRLLAEGSFAVASGIPWVATNVDPTIPTARGLAPGNGALVAAIEMATGRHPVVAGKPELPLHREAVQRTGARRPLVVGDRMDTDIEAAHRAGADSLLVLTGVTTATQLVGAPSQQRPTYAALDLRALAARPEDLAVSAGLTRRGAFSAAVEEGVLRLAASGEAGVDEADAVRAACGAAWAAADRREPVRGVARALAMVAGPHRAAAPGR